MIKLICLGAVPLLVAYIYGGRDPEPMVPSFYAVEETDRIFLANLDAQDAADRRAPAQRETNAPAPVPVAVPVPVPVAVAVPVVKPMPVRAAIPIPVARAVPVVRDTPEQPTATAQTAIVRETTTTPGSDGMSVGRNASRTVTDLGTEMEVRRAIPAAPHHTVYRAANGSYQGEVFTFPAYSGAH